MFCMAEKVERVEKKTKGKPYTSLDTIYTRLRTIWST